MSDFVRIMRNKNTMCKTFKYCTECPLSKANTDSKLNCDNFMALMPEKAEEIVNDFFKMNGVHIMESNEYQKLAARTINKSLTPEQTLNHALFGMVGEVGEIHSIYQKEMQGHPIDLTHVQKECSDLLWFIAELHTHYGWELSDTMTMNIEKLKARYPEGFETEKSLNRKEGDI